MKIASESEHNFIVGRIALTAKYHEKSCDLFHQDEVLNATRFYHFKGSFVNTDSLKVVVYWNSYVIGSDGKPRDIDNKGTFETTRDEWSGLATTVATLLAFFQINCLNGFLKRLPIFGGDERTGEGHSCFLPDGTPIQPLEFVATPTNITEEGADDGEIAISITHAHAEQVSCSVNGGEYSTEPITGLAPGAYKVNCKYVKVGDNAPVPFTVNGIEQTIKIQ
jgi:hypothetical protein